MTISSEDQILAAIEDAESIPDLLDGLVDRTKANAGAPFAQEVLEALICLRVENLPRFESLRQELKSAGCRVTALDKALSSAADDGARAPTQADQLIALAQEAEFFHGPDDTPFADVTVGEHRETWRVRSKGFRQWLVRRFYEKTAGAPSSEALQSALNVLESIARFDGPMLEVRVRVAGHGDRLYIDLCDDEWRIVEVDANGWRICGEPPVRFYRTAGMLPLPEPERGGTIETLRRFLNVRNERDFVLVVAWALAVLRERGPYPVLALSGEQGSAKSTFSAVLRRLLDPNAAPLRALPREEHHLFIAATNAHVLSFDNISRLSSWQSDTFCRLATGGGFAVRQLYTDMDEVLFEAARPVILNGIEDVVDRPDLADRAIFLTLQAIREEERRPEKELWEDFDARHAKILGSLLDAVSSGVRRLPDTRMRGLPRLADFALWSKACEEAFWPSGTFEAAYRSSRDDAIETVIESDIVGSAIRTLMSDREEWRGTATKLLQVLESQLGESVSRSRSWPKSTSQLSGRVTRSATFLRSAGIEIEHSRAGDRLRTRIIRIYWREPERKGSEASAASAPSERAVKAFPDSGPWHRLARTPVDADAPAQPLETDAACTSSPHYAEMAAADGADATLPADSGGEEAGDRHGW